MLSYHLSQAARHYFPVTRQMSESGTPSLSRTTEVLRVGLIETVLAVPKIALGTRVAISATEALRPQALIAPERGVAGCISYAVAKTTQFLCAAAGALVGVVASAAGMLVGCGGWGWVDQAAGKGWQVGTMVATGIMLPSEIARTALSIVAFALFIGTAAAKNVEDILQQATALLRPAPPYSQTT